MIQERTERVRDGAETNEPLSTADLAHRARMDSPSEAAAKENAAAGERVPLFADSELGDLRRRWTDVQGSFVDDPRSAVRTADELVASLMTRLAQVFAEERTKLEHEWDTGENVSTEDLRVALHRYRSFFDRLLSA